ncbi:lysophospholipid acyltransferase family protein [Phytohalomonas tamaricis]|uniref:lysophospholipid acyltransferase family protein n=1 Tax=Phytohalomonas tamaricis TaxID=2081032 RepID=UPI000D0AC693|nr:lysophospholipid acyltransferase family protein [Phytohalomonas tamaricis]
MNALRSLIFYIGYVLAIILSFLTLVPVALCLPLKMRFKALNLYNRFIIFWLRLVCGIRYTIEMPEPLPEGPCVLLSNHQSEWETIYLQLLKPPVCTVLKKELLRVPVFGWALRLLEPIPLDRSKPSSALKQVFREGAQRLQDGLSILIFPEGTRVPPGARKRFNKSGVHIACRAGVPVIPIAHNAGEYWPSRTWIKSPGRLTLVVGPAIPTKGRTPDEVAAYVEGWIEDQLRRISDVPRPDAAEEAARIGV